MLTLETSALETLYDGQFTSSTLSSSTIKPNYLVVPSPTQHHCFFGNVPPLIQLLKGGHVYWHIVRYFTVAPPNTGRVPPSRRYLMVKIKGESVRSITSPPWSSICSSLRISKTTRFPCRLCTETPPRRPCSSTTSVNLDKTNNGNMVYWNLHNSNIRLSFVKRMKKRKAQR